MADADKFDARFWGLQPHEVSLLDPQQRLFLQTAYHALEDSGSAGKDREHGKGGKQTREDDPAAPGLVQGGNPAA